MAQKKEYVNLTSPLVVARYPKLGQQDVYDGKEVGYKLGCLPHDEAAWEKFKSDIEEASEKLTKAAGKKTAKFTPVREDKEGNEYIEFKSYKKVPLFAPKGGKKLPEGTLAKIGGGSLLRVQVSLTFSNGGVTGYMNSIQLAKLVEKGEGGFDDLDVDDIDVPDQGFDDVDEGDGDGLDL